MRIGINSLLSLVFQAKVSGKGRLGKGRIYVKLMSVITDTKNTGNLDIITKFGGNTESSDDYQKIDKFLNRLLKNQTSYPYILFSFNKFEKSIGNTEIYMEYVRRMSKVCDEIFDKDKINSLVYTFLEIMRQDDNFNTILYGGKFIEKECFFGNYAHPKKICTEILLLGLLYHVHKNPSESENMNLISLPEKIKFKIVNFKDEKSFDLDINLNLCDNICQTAKGQKSKEMKYKLEFKFNNEISNELFENGNIFLYGSGGIGKTTILLNLLNSKSTIDFYFPLYKYRPEIREKFRSESCYILLQILLKYHYQYEYQTYESCCASESESTILKQLNELNQDLKNSSYNKPKYTLFLDGINEMSPELQEYFSEELKWILKEWKNVRFIITGRIFPDYGVYSKFQKVEVCGVSENEKNDVLEKNGIILLNDRLAEILNNPLFLNMYIESQSTKREINTRGELLDSYVMNMESRFSEDSTLRFVVQYALPFLAYNMVVGYDFEISRSKILEAIDQSFETYLNNEIVYQNYIAPKKYRKKSLLRNREKYDFVDILIENTGFFTVSEDKPNKLHFIHQYFRDYFAAKQILNLSEAIVSTYEYHNEEKEKLFQDYNLESRWFDNEDGKEVYRLIGEISEDYRNSPCEKFSYHKTILDSLIDISHNFFAIFTIENVVKVMSLVRDGIICGVNFKGTVFPQHIPENTRFSLDGKYPCSFRNCTIIYCRNFEEDFYVEGEIDFKNCDFTGIDCWNESYINKLVENGAIIDEDVIDY